jgi:putative protein kinase ArgK-like GTPase of G3E family
MLEATRELSRRLLLGDRQALARSITLIESLNEKHREQAAFLLDEVFIAMNKKQNNNNNASIVTTNNPPVGLNTVLLDIFFEMCVILTTFFFLMPRNIDIIN